MSNFHNTATKMIAQSPMASALTLFKGSINTVGLCMPHSRAIKKTGRYSWMEVAMNEIQVPNDVPVPDLISKNFGK